MIREYLEMAWSLLLHPIAGHVLQSTLCVVLAGLAATGLRRNGARTRYWIWFAALLKFLIPFSLLLGIGGQLGALLPASRGPEFAALMDYISDHAAVAMAPLKTPVRASYEPIFAAVAIGVWFLGFSAVTLSWMRRWWRLRTALRVAAPFPEGVERHTILRLQERARVLFPIRVVTAAFDWSPAVLGIFRPVLLLPVGFSRHLGAAQMEAVLAHELAHIRRRDNLLAILHMPVVAAFWFHPLVWWLSAKLLEERERACDEEVLRMGSEPEAYAEGILRVCQLCVDSPLPCVSGIRGSDLTSRIENIMSHGPGIGLNLAKKFMLGGLAAAVILGPVGAGLWLVPHAVGQEREAAGQRPSFTVAAVKPTDPKAAGLRISFGPGGRLTASYVTLRFLIKIAYDLRDDQIGGGPPWLGSKRYDVEAKCDPPLPGEPKGTEFSRQIRLRLQSLLADRFHLVLKEESKDMPVFYLELAKSGPRLKAASVLSGGKNDVRVSDRHMEATDANMEFLTGFLSEHTGRSVFDKTGLSGHYALKLDWIPDPSLGMGPGVTSSTDARVADPGPSLFTALQEQLGLKLESHKAPARFVVVDRAELPTEN
jgi:bla regulator protein BlaR1